MPARLVALRSVWVPAFLGVFLVGWATDAHAADMPLPTDARQLSKEESAFLFKPYNMPLDKVHLPKKGIWVGEKVYAVAVFSQSPELHKYSDGLTKVLAQLLDERGFVQSVVQMWPDDVRDADDDKRIARLAKKKGGEFALIAEVVPAELEGNNPKFHFRLLSGDGEVLNEKKVDNILVLWTRAGYRTRLKGMLERFHIAVPETVAAPSKQQLQAFKRNALYLRVESWTVTNTRSGAHDRYEEFVVTDVSKTSIAPADLAERIEDEEVRKPFVKARDARSKGLKLMLGAASGCLVPPFLGAIAGTVGMIGGGVLGTLGSMPNLNDAIISGLVFGVCGGFAVGALFTAIGTAVGAVLAGSLVVIGNFMRQPDSLKERVAAEAVTEHNLRKAVASRLDPFSLDMQFFPAAIE